MKLLLKNGRVYDPRCQLNGIQELLICDGILEEIEETIHDEEAQILDCEGKWIIPSVIDMHTHVYADKTALGLCADEIGVDQNIGVVVDAGSAGADDFEDFLAQNQQSQTRVKAFINYSKIGLTQDGGELSNIEYLDEKKCRETILKHKDNIVGIKLRASGSVVKDQGFKPIELGKQFAASMNLPVMVHVGNYPPRIEEVLAILTKNDIITHIFHGKEGGILDEFGNIKSLVLQKQQAGILYDVGHGSASFDANVAKKAIAQGLIPDLISSDLHQRNFKKKINDCFEVATKLLGCGMTLEEVIQALSIKSAEIIGLDNRILKNNQARINIISVQPLKQIVRDASFTEFEINEKIVNEGLFYDGRIPMEEQWKINK